MGVRALWRMRRRNAGRGWGRDVARAGASKPRRPRTPEKAAWPYTGTGRRKRAPVQGLAGSDSRVTERQGLSRAAPRRTAPGIVAVRGCARAAAVPCARLVVSTAYEDEGVLISSSHSLAWHRRMSDGQGRDAEGRGFAPVQDRALALPDPLTSHKVAALCAGPRARPP